MNAQQTRRWNFFLILLLAGCAAHPSPPQNGLISPTLGNANGAPALQRLNASLTRAPNCAAASAPFTLFSNEQAARQGPRPHRSLSDTKPIAPPDISHYVQTGHASWYGPRFAGHRTANGEKYNMYALTAAHRTLPLASYVRVTNPSNGKSVVVRINDRGPFQRNRIIDLSYAAAGALGIRQAGTSQVKLQGLSAQEAQEIQAARD